LCFRLLEEFGADSLQFKLYAFIDLHKGGGTSTDLLIAILDAFDEGGITSPLPRTDVTLRNIRLAARDGGRICFRCFQRKDDTQRESWLASLSGARRSERAAPPKWRTNFVVIEVSV
jgi:small-conductance mechanosensitive channel